MPKKKKRHRKIVRMCVRTIDKANASSKWFAFLLFNALAVQTKATNSVKRETAGTAATRAPKTVDTNTNKMRMKIPSTRQRKTDREKERKDKNS